MKTDLNKRYQALLGLWLALLMNIGVLFLVALFFAPKLSNETSSPRSSMLVFTLTAVAVFLVMISFAVKGKILERSVEKQDIDLVQKGLVIACALCEVSALLGLLERFLTGNRQYYLMFLIAAAGTAFHFPRREQLEAASYKSSSMEPTF